jgi:uncharacterized membrane protein YraQ (UPF0718 family)
MNKALKRYLPFLLVLAGFVAVAFFMPAARQRMFDSILSQLKTMLLVLPPIFILLGLMDVWIPREKMVRYLGEKSSVSGALIAFLLGSLAAGPLYGAFPFAAVLIKKGSSLRNVMIFIGAWSTTKIPMLLFEITSMGLRFALTRLAVDILGILVIAFILERFSGPAEVERLRSQAESML